MQGIHLVPVTVCGCPSGISRKSAQTLVENAIHISCMGRRIRLLHSILRAESILSDNGHKHVPLTAVTHGKVQKITKFRTVEITVQFILHAAHEPVGFFQLVIESDEVLGQFKLLDVILMADLFTQNIHCRENPAASGLQLVGYRHGLQIDGKDIGIGIFSLKDAADGADIILDKGISDNSCLIVFCVRMAHGCKCTFTD